MFHKINKNNTMNGAGPPPPYAPQGQPVGQLLQNNEIQPVIMQQPRTGEISAWLPNNQDGSHPLQYINGVILTQKISITELVTGFEKANKFDITDMQTGLLLGKFVEESECCERNFCKPIRSFKADITHHSGHPLFKIERPMQCLCQCGCYTIGGGVGKFCGNSMIINDKFGNLIGFIELQTSFACPFGSKWLSIMDSNRQVKYLMGGNLFDIGCGNGAGGMCGDKHVQILDANGRRISTIVKKWQGIMKEGMTDADVLHLPFPAGSDHRDKCLLIGATLLIDYLIFEKKDN